MTDDDNHTKFDAKDQGGTRSGTDRRKSAKSDIKRNRRSGRDRRSGFDRRRDIGRRRGSRLRNSQIQSNQESIERRDVFRSRP